MIDYNKLFQLVLDRSECRLERDGETFAVYGNDFNVNDNENACFGKGYTKPSEILDVCYEQITYHVVDDFKDDLGLAMSAEWGEVFDALKEEYVDSEELEEDPIACDEYNMLAMLVLLDDELNAAVDLNAVYERALEEHRLMQNIAENANASLIVEEFLKTQNFCILPVDTGGFFLYNAEYDSLYPSFEFMSDDQIYDDISVTKNADGTYHVEYVGKKEPSQLFKDDCGDMYEGYNDAISDISSLAVVVDTYEAQGKLVDDMLQAASVGGNPALYDIVKKYELGMFSRVENFARAANAIKETDPSLYEKHKLCLQVAEIYGAPNVDEKLNINDVYQIQKSRGDNLFDKNDKSSYKTPKKSAAKAKAEMEK